MVAAAMKHMASKFAKLDKFEGMVRMQEQIKKRNKWENDDYVCRCLILNSMSDPLFDIYQNVKSSKETWDSLEAKYMNQDASSKKFLDDDIACNQMFKLNIVNDNIGSAFMSTSKLNDSIIWHARLGHVYYKRMQDMSKDGLILSFDKDTKNDLCDLHATLPLGNKKYFALFIDDASRAVVRLPNPKLKTLGERGIECIFVGYAEHSKAFRFYVIGPNESVLINSITESRNAIFDENRFSSVPRLMSTPMDISEKLMPNNGKAVSQLKYSRVVGCLMYVMTCTRPDIAFDVGKLSKYTSNPGTQHWNSTKLEMIVGNFVQLWVQFILGNGVGAKYGDGYMGDQANTILYRVDGGDFMRYVMI
ncbi:zinc finger, CCHC-type containing protein [Tanacetum coccineum]